MNDAVDADKATKAQPWTWRKYSEKKAIKKAKNNKNNSNSSAAGEKKKEMKTIIKRHSINICPLCADTVCLPHWDQHREEQSSAQTEAEAERERENDNSKNAVHTIAAVQLVGMQYNEFETERERAGERNWCCATVGDINYNCKQRETTESNGFYK